MVYIRIKLFKYTTIFFACALLVQEHSRALTSVEIYTVTKLQYLKQFKSLLPKEFCAEGYVFQKCFNLTEAQCQSEAQVSFRSCSNKVHLPNRINWAADGSKIGNQLGECIGLDFYQRNRKNITQLPICQQRKTWW